VGFLHPLIFSSMYKLQPRFFGKLESAATLRREVPLITLTPYFSLLWSMFSYFSLDNDPIFPDSRSHFSPPNRFGFLSGPYFPSLRSDISLASRPYPPPFFCRDVFAQRAIFYLLLFAKAPPRVTTYYDRLLTFYRVLTQIIR